MAKSEKYCDRFYLMKSILSALILLFGVNASAQIRNYYLSRDFPKSTGQESNHTFDIEITGVSYRHVEKSLTTYFKSTLKYERIGFLTSNVNDSVLLVTERFKNINDPEINPKFEFLDLKFRIFKMGSDSIIERLDAIGSEAMLGEFYKKYWNAELNLIDLKNPVIISETKNANDLVQLNYQPVKSKESVFSPYSISVTSVIDNMSEVLKDTKVFLAQRNKKKHDFDVLRNTTRFPLKHQESTYYEAKKREIELELRAVLTTKKNITGSCEVVVRKDTTGLVWVSVDGKNGDINAQLREALLTLTYKNYVLNGFKMDTEDKFVYEYSFIRETVDLLKKPMGITAVSKNQPEVESLARKEASGFWMDKADLTYDVSILNLNGSKQETVLPTKAVERTTAGKAIGGFFAGVLVVIVALLDAASTE